jgi:5S rRNA maturation endonuclease (ribonuclease M5)
MTREQIISTNPIADFVRSRGHELKPAGKNFVTSGCPVTQHKPHHRPVTINTQKHLWHCNDCDRGGSIIDWIALQENITAAAAMRELGGGRNGLEPVKAKLVKTYDYNDETGELLFQVCRFRPKDFKQRRPDGKGEWTWNTNGVPRVLYRLPEVIKANIVCITEGEKDADNLAKLGFTATTNVGGAGQWRDEYSEALRDKDVIIFGDDDQKGRAHVDSVIESLTGIARSIKRVTLPDGCKDVSDYIASLPRGTAKKAICTLIDAAKSAQSAGTPAAWFDQKFPALADEYGEAVVEQTNKKGIVLVRVINKDFLGASLGEKGTPDAPTVYIEVEQRFYSYDPAEGIFVLGREPKLMAKLSALLLL